MAQDAKQKAAAYIRVSQERAARNGYGLDAQEHNVHKYVEYNDWGRILTFDFPFRAFKPHVQIDLS